MYRLIVLFSLVGLGSWGVSAQALTDTVLTWRSYTHDRSARVRVFTCEDENRPLTVIVDERAESAGGPVTDEVRYVAETIGRTLGFDPVEATFVFRFTASGFTPSGGEEGKTLLLRATFRRGTSGDLTSPNWRVVSRDELSDLTDRALY